MMRTDPTDVPGPTLPEYAGNPFIAGLGAMRDPFASLALMTETPVVGDLERGLPHHLRRHCLARVLRWCQPRSCQIELVETIDVLLRQGYVGRNPTTGTHHAAILDAADRADPGDFAKSSRRGLVSTASGFVLVGHPGMGKSLTLDRIVASYPDAVRHVFDYAALTQVPIVKIDMPYVGSVKAICRAMILQIGRRVGQETEYDRLYAHGRATVDSMTLDIQRLVQLHAVGLLVVDEVQHLLQGREDPQHLMNFLTTLTNVHGVPVVLVGTMGALDVVEGQFRVARRAAGEPQWLRLHQGQEWTDFVEQLWSFQWTATLTPLTKELSQCLHDESQGILDIAVKLFWVAQRSAIWRGEVSQDVDEAITVDLLRHVAKNNFHVIQPMIAALRSGRPEKLIGFRDLDVLRNQLDGLLSSDTGLTPERFFELRRRQAEQEAGAGEAQGGSWRSNMAKTLCDQGYGVDAVGVLLDEVERRNPDGGFLANMKTLQTLMDGTAEPCPPTGGDPSKPAAPPVVESMVSRDRSPLVARAGGGARSTTSHGPSLEADDLRFAAAGANERERALHGALVDLGVCVSLEDHLRGLSEGTQAHFEAA